MNHSLIPNARLCTPLGDRLLKCHAKRIAIIVECVCRWQQERQCAFFKVLILYRKVFAFNFKNFQISNRTKIGIHLKKCLFHALCSIAMQHNIVPNCHSKVCLLCFCMAGWESRPSKRKQLTAGLGLTHGKELFTLSSSNLPAYNLCYLCSFVVFLTFTWRLSETQVLSSQSDPNRSLSQMAVIEVYILRSDFYFVHMLPCSWFCCI